MNQDELKDILHYCPDSGVFTWIKPSKEIRNKDAVGWIDNHGYRSLRINGKQHKAHRLAFLYMTGTLPSQHTDHINGIRNDNRWDNIREASHSENMRNKAIKNNNTSGFSGVNWVKSRCRWVATIGVGGKKTTIGYFVNLSDAVKARIESEVKYNYHPNHGRTV